MLYSATNFTKSASAGTDRSPGKMYALTEIQEILLLIQIPSRLEEIAIASIQPVSNLSIQIG